MNNEVAFSNGCESSNRGIGFLKTPAHIIDQALIHLYGTPLQRQNFNPTLFLFSPFVPVVKRILCPSLQLY
jgi:hypothetical protein